MGRRISVLPPTLRDRAEFVAAVRASRTLHRPWVAPPDEGAAFGRFVRRSRSEEAAAWLVRAEDGRLAGVFNLGHITRGPLQSAYLGYYAFIPLAGNGYMSEGIRPVLRSVFTELKLHRVEANVQPQNAASISLVRRAGFRKEGFSPRYLKVGGRWRDHERWAMTLEDWRQDRRRGDERPS